MFTQDQIKRFEARRRAEAQLTAPTQKPTGTTGRGGTLTSLISEGGALGGAAIGAGIGSAVPIIGTAIGGAIGAGLGAFGGRLAENKVRDDRFDTSSLKQAAGEGALSAVLSAPLKGVKYGATAAKASRGGATLTEALKTGAKAADSFTLRGAVKGGASKVGGKLVSGLDDKASATFLNLSPGQTQKLLDAGIDTNTLAKRAASFGNTAEDIIGRTGNKGPLQETIRSLENGITKEASTAGKNVRIPGEEIIKALKAEAKSIKKEIGSGARLKAINTIIKDAEAKYAKGITVQQARNTLKQANQKFGASVLETTGDAVASAAQKLEANTLRTALKDRFPAIATALDSESELIQLREVLKKSRARDLSGKLNVAQFDLTKPGSFVNPIIKNPRVTGAVLRRGAGEVAQEAATPTALGAAVRALPRATAVQGVEGMFGAPRPQEQRLDTQPLDTISADTLPQELPQAPTISREQTLQAMAIDLAETGGQNFSKIQALYEFANPVNKANEEKPLGTEAQKRALTSQSGLRSLQTLEETLASDPGAFKRQALPNPFGITAGITNTTDVRAATDNVVDVIARLGSGAAITDEEAARFARLLPQPGDSVESAARKLANVRAELESFMQPVTNSDLENAILQYGM